ncbi:anthranilate synthase component I [Planctomicrobium piriforme]|uniref:Anthranilate synthase component 1 n=1 Tax=Planctomicrobium piriforme TaxID=1576369 RepID=A0A1I3TCP0_9PLAN|nr:anthranilate synthase component I [Planctomicrobium piriforme]SFJ67257.1 anthranilate synthase component 1 [Planctomicrobium piriforme]
MHHPSFTEFQSLATEASLVPVYRMLYSDTLTPVSAFCKAGWQNDAFLFESVVGGERVGRYSFLGGDPFLRIEAYGQELVITRRGKEERRTVEDPLNELEHLLQQYRAVQLPELPLFVGGAVGYAGYDVVRYTERLPKPPEDDRHLADMSFALYDAMIIFDHIRKTTLVVVHARTDVPNPQAEYEKACARIDVLCQRLHDRESGLSMPDVDLKLKDLPEWTSDCSQAEYENAVRACQEYIRAGDIFQVVLSQRLEVDTIAQPMDVYRALRVVNPSPFMFLLQTPKCTLVGSSPEIMVRVEHGVTTIRPLAGTRPRGANAEEDQALAADLLADPKERAEHVMLVDLARNDVGRIAEYGSVTLNDVMVVERYSHVMHITSNVFGKLRKGLSALAALRAGLPAGTVSGAPKVRAMEIIDQFEKHRRGPYGGAVGYLDFTGNMDTCIALRTIVMMQGKAYVQVGAGVVADSVPASEYQETMNKARGQLKALALAESICRRT